LIVVSIISTIFLVVISMTIITFIRWMIM